MNGSPATASAAATGHARRLSSPSQPPAFAFDFRPPPDTLVRIRHAAPDGGGLVFEISEDLPPHWREGIPLVLETLRANLKEIG